MNANTFISYLKSFLIGLMIIINLFLYKLILENKKEPVREIPQKVVVNTGWSITDNLLDYEQQKSVCKNLEYSPFQIFIITDPSGKKYIAICRHNAIQILETNAK